MAHRGWLVSGCLILIAAALALGAGAAAGEIAVDLTRWTPPDIATIGDDPFGTLVKYGRALVADTANQIGPTVADPARRFPATISIARVVICRQAPRPTPCRSPEFGANSRSIAAAKATS